MVAILSERSGKALPEGQFRRVRRVRRVEMGVLPSPSGRGLVGCLPHLTEGLMR